MASHKLTDEATEFASAVNDLRASLQPRITALEPFRPDASASKAEVTQVIF